MTTTGTVAPLTRPTLYFVGVTTARSSIMKVFPVWARILGLDADICGLDAPLHAPADHYRRIVEAIRDDPLAAGALVTSHKLDLFAAAADLFDQLDPYAKLSEEVSCISTRADLLIGHAKDPVTSGLALAAIVPAGHWQDGDAQVLCLGAGGAAVAIGLHLATATEGPERFVAVDIDSRRLEHLEAILQRVDAPFETEFVVNADPNRNDALMAGLPPGSLVINATGMGKDRPGSPLGDRATFPQRGLVWELNYRGALDFLHQARAQREERQLRIEDGWVYFLHGWTQVIAEVFDLDLGAELFGRLDRAAAAVRSS